MSVINYKSIVALFLNGLFAIGVILLVVGFVSTINLTAKLIVFDEYPLNPYEENCSTFRPVMAEKSDPTSTTSAEPESISSRQDCESNLSYRRKIKLVDDVSHSLGMLTAGIIMSYLFNPRSRFVANLI